MITVKLKSGAYGQRIGIQNILRVKGDIFDLEDTEANRLIAENIAERIVATACEESSGDALGINNRNKDNNADNDNIPEYSIKTKATELRDIAKRHGITFAVGISKEEMISQLDKYFSVEETDESAPMLNAELPS